MFSSLLTNSLRYSWTYTVLILLFNQLLSKGLSTTITMTLMEAVATCNISSLVTKHPRRESQMSFFLISVSRRTVCFIIQGCFWRFCDKSLCYSLCWKDILERPQSTTFGGFYTPRTPQIIAFGRSFSVLYFSKWFGFSWLFDKNRLHRILPLQYVLCGV